MATRDVNDGDHGATTSPEGLDRARGGNRDREADAAAGRHATAPARRGASLGAPRRGERRADRDTTLAQYLRGIGTYPLLSRDEERALARRLRAGDEDALGRLVCANLRFVVLIAKRYQHQGLPLPDLINEGNLGLIRAAHKFDETKGIKFISYAVWWIRQAILQALAEQSRIVRVPVNRAGALHRIVRRAEALQQELGREATHAEIAEGTDVAEEEVARAMAISRAHVSLDAPLTPGEDHRLLDYLADDAALAPDVAAVERALADVLQAGLSRLKEREAKILRLYFGLDGEEPMTLDQIGPLLGITRERVRQIKEKALSRLRAGRLGKALSEFQ
jgi:RNA polymerase primary sigma factor